MKLKRVTISPSMIVAMIALFVALGGAGYAAVTAAKNSVTSLSIKNGQVKTPDLASNAVTGAKIKNGQVGLADLSTAAKTDLNDANSVGGLSVAQIVAAAGGQYFEARQAAGSVDIDTLTPQPLTTLSLPTAGKYLINARMPVTCTYDGSGAGGAPADTITLHPNIVAKAELLVNGTVTDTLTQTCEAEGGIVVVIAGVLLGKNVVEITRQITTTGPATVALRGLAETSIVLVTAQPASARVNADASGSIVQAISVR